MCFHSQTHRLVYIQYLSCTCSLFEEFSSWVCRRLCRRVIQLLHRVCSKSTQRDTGLLTKKHTNICTRHAHTHTHSLPLSGRMSLQGRARGVMECWQTRAVRLPVSEIENTFIMNIFQTAPLSTLIISGCVRSNGTSCTSSYWPVEGGRGNTLYSWDPVL